MPDGLNRAMGIAEPVDPLELARQLIRCPSVTPSDAGALDVLQTVLEPRGFRCQRLTFASPGTEAIDNLYARFGEQSPNFCFAGHTDVVPVGDAAGWSVDPFAGVVKNCELIGRGAADMKGAIACFVAAADRLCRHFQGKLSGSISLLITGDEEGPAINGTAKVLDWLKARKETPDACLIGEPTNPSRLGQMVKIGRRGSLNGRLTVFGEQGHTAYPHLADNPIPKLARAVIALEDEPLDQGDGAFEPSHLALTSLDVGNPAFNVIPAQATAAFNIRYNTRQDPTSLEAWLKGKLDAMGLRYRLSLEPGAEPFLAKGAKLGAELCAAVRDVLGLQPELSTSGGTSDGRFLYKYCEVAEFGMVGATAHKVDERIALEDLERLTAVYYRVLERYFGL
jgi:succinyl-diaminopimelate desuccinylase